MRAQASHSGTLRILYVALGSSGKSKVPFILISELIQVSLLALASSYMSHKKIQQLLLNMIK